MSRRLLAAGGMSLAAGAMAFLTAGAAHRVALTALLLSGLLLAILVSREARLLQARDRGYVPPRSRRVQLLHVLVTVLYNAGIMVVVFAALVRFRVLAVQLEVGVYRQFPLLLGCFLLLLAFAAHWRIQAGTGIARTWYTRAHAVLLTLLAAPVVALALALVARDDLRLPGLPPIGEGDLQVGLLLATLGVGTQLFLAVNLPTAFDLYASVGRILTRRATGRGTPPVLYTAFLALGVTVLLGALAAFLDLPARIAGFGDARIGLVIAMFPIAIAVFFLVAAFQLLRESRRGLYRRRFSAALRADLFIYAGSAVAGLTFAVLLAMVLTGHLDTIGPIATDLDTGKDLMVLAVLATAGPIGIHLHRKNRRLDDLESRLPDFLNDLAETRRAGLTMAASLQSTALSDYGSLTPEVQKMAHQVAWGISFTEALQQFADRMSTSLVQRSVSLIREASRTGGSVAEILKAAARDAYEIRALQQERRVSMTTYLIVIYVVFFVFVGVLGIIDSQFIPHVVAAQEATAASPLRGSPLGSAGFDADQLRFAYFNAAFVQAIGNGLMGGVITDGRLTSGFRHVALMAVLAWLVFRLLLG